MAPNGFELKEDDFVAWPLKSGAGNVFGEWFENGGEMAGEIKPKDCSGIIDN